MNQRLSSTMREGEEKKNNARSENIKLINSTRGDTTMVELSTVVVCRYYGSWELPTVVISPPC